MNERIPRREAPDFRDSEDGLISSIIEDGFLNVALDDANQYGPHAMIVLLGIVSVITGSVLGLAMIDPMLSAGAIALLLVASILQSRFRLLGD
tara:strand:+ start:23878 stop:24156 length:279 start_codon:yes stop_codon:yes gene_type:complete